MRSFLRGFLLVFSIMSVHLGLMGQVSQLNFTQYNEEDGLSENSLNSIYQDQRGFIWIGTSLGFNRFDGKDFKKFYPNQLLTKHQNAEMSRVFFENRKNSLICLIGNFEAYTFNTVSQKLRVITPLKQTNCTHFQRLDPQTIAVSTPDTAWVFDNDFRLLYKITPPTLQKEMSVYVLPLDAKRYLVYTPKEHFIYTVQTKEYRKLNIKINLTENQKTGFVVLYWDAIRSELYLSNYFKGLYKVNLKGEVLHHWENNQNGKNVTANSNGFHLDPFHKNIAWISGENGLSKLNLRTKLVENFSTLSLLGKGDIGHSNITGILFDQNKTLWVASKRGLYRKNELSEFIRIKNITYPKEIEFMNMVKAADGHYYVSGYFGPVWRIHPKKDQIEEIRSFQNKGSWFVLRDDFKLIQGGSGTGLNYYNTATKQLTSTNFLRDYFPHSDLIVLGVKHSNGDMWFSGNQRGGLVRFCKKTNTYSTFSSALNSFSDSYFTCSTESPNGDLWFGSNRSTAIVQWDMSNEKFEEINFKEAMIDRGILRSGINTLISDKMGNIWIGFDGSGILKYSQKNGEFTAYNRNNGLPSNFVYNLLFDDKNRLWIGTNKGLSCFFPSTNKVVSYNQKNGFPCQSITNSCGLFDPETKEIWMTTGNSLFSFQPDQILRRNNGKMTVFIDEFIVNNVSVLSENSVHFNLQPDQNNLRIRFGAIHAQSDNAVEYSYRLFGGAPNWVYCDGQNQINFPNLSAGDYEFLVRARFKGSPKWTWLKSNLQFTILLPWHKTWWFISLICIAVFLISTFIIRLYLSKKIAMQKAIVERQLAVQMERDRIAFDMHDDLGSGLTKITYLSKAASKKPMHNEELQKIQNTSLELVENMSELIWAMKVENDSLLSLLTYLKQYAVEYLDSNTIKNKFLLPEFETDFQVSGETRRNIFLMIKEALHNIVKHADATEVKISIELNEHLKILIHDNGQGISVDGTKINGTGLNSMHKRAERLGGEVNILSRAGTEINFSFPIKNIHL